MIYRGRAAFNEFMIAKKKYIFALYRIKYTHVIKLWARELKPRDILVKSIEDEENKSIIVKKNPAQQRERYTRFHSGHCL